MNIISLPLPVTLVNGIVADGGQVQTDLNYIATAVNANAASSGANNDITSLDALLNLPPNLSAKGLSLTNSTINLSTINTSSIDSSTVGVTQPIGTSSKQLATMEAVTQAAFFASLPGITNLVKDYLTTNDGSVGSWTKLLKNSVIHFADALDVTKQIAFDSSAVSTGTTRTIHMPDRDINLSGVNDYLLIAQGVI